MAEVEPLDVHNLARFRITVQDSAERRWLRPEDVEGCKVGALLTAPTAAALVRAGLPQPTGSGGYGPSDPVLEMTPWGDLFLDWLAKAPEAQSYFAPPP